MNQVSLNPPSKAGGMLALGVGRLGLEPRGLAYQNSGLKDVEDSTVCSTEEDELLPETPTST